MFIRFIKLNGYILFIQDKRGLFELVFLFYLLLMFSIPPLLRTLNLTNYNPEDFSMILLAVMGLLSFIFYLPQKLD
jgi:hypothetical protein